MLIQRVDTADRFRLRDSKISSLFVESFLVNYSMYQNDKDALYFLTEGNDIIDFVYTYEFGGKWDVCRYIYPNLLPHVGLCRALNLTVYAPDSIRMIAGAPTHKSLLRSERKCKDFTVKPATWEEFEALKAQWAIWFKEKFGKEPTMRELEHRGSLELYQQRGLYDMFGVYDKDKCISVSGFYKTWDQSYYYAFTYWNPEYRNYGLGLYSILIGHKQASKERLQFDLGLYETADGVKFEFKEMWNPMRIIQPWVKPENQAHEINITI
jgi:hypothetical protein